MDDKKIIIILVVSLIVGYLDINFLLTPQRRSQKDKSVKIGKLKKDIEGIKREIEIIRKQPAVKEEQHFKAKQFISEDNLPSLLNEISGVANKNKISLVQIRPSKETRQKDDKTQIPTVKLAPVNISLEVLGDYHNLGSFINGLENAPTFMSVEELKISATAGNYFQQRAALLIRTYVKK